MLALLASVLVVQVPTASAGIPSVILTTSMSGTHYILNVTVNHPATTAISNSHYVDQVQIVTTNASGDKWVNVTISGSTLVDAQTNVTFRFLYDVGSLGLNTTVSAKAHCVIHGWGSAGTATVGPAAPAVPSAPPSLIATAGNGYVKLTWSAPTTIGSSAITNYTVYRASSDYLTSGNLTSYKVLGNVTAYNDTAVTNNITYYYSVTATNGVGESAKSAVSFTTPTPGGTTPASPDNTMLIVGIAAIVLILIVVTAVMMRRKSSKEKPKQQ